MLACLMRLATLNVVKSPGFEDVLLYTALLAGLVGLGKFDKSQARV
jgi:hypothetical protein